MNNSVDKGMAKKDHAEKVSHCWHFSSGTCPYRDEQCWFIHATDKSNSSVSEYTCNICEKVCSNHSNFLQHRKKYHEEHVPSCKNFYKGECTYGNGKCWFNHNDNKIIIENEHENKDVVQRIFKMMEKMTDRIVKMEMNHQEQNNEN